MLPSNTFQVIAVDTGTPSSFSLRYDIPESVQCVRYNAGLAGKFSGEKSRDDSSVLTYEPFGVVLIS